MNLMMARALALAARGQYSTAPNPAVGCVLEKDGDIIGEGWHQFAGEPHAEIHALNDAQSRGESTAGCIAYVTLEPCSHHGKTPPCADALIAAGVAKVVMAMRDPNPQVAGQGLARLQATGIEVEVLGGEAEARASELNRGFIKRMSGDKQGVPWVTLKLACSLDGKTAMDNGESQWITSAQAREDGHRLRARADAVLTASGTVLADDAKMTARLPAAEGEIKQPVRVVLDRELKIPAGATIFSADGETWLFCSHAADAARGEASPADAVLPVVSGTQGLDLPSVLSILGQHEVNEVLVEAGSKLSGAFIGQGLVDELVVYVAPDVLGSNTRGLLEIPAIRHLTDKRQFEFQRIEMLGRDAKLTLRPGKIA